MKYLKINLYYIENYYNPLALNHMRSNKLQIGLRNCQASTNFQSPQASMHDVSMTIHSHIKYN